MYSARGQSVKRHENLPEVVCVKNGNNTYLNITIPHIEDDEKYSPSDAKFFQVRGEGLLRSPASNYMVSVVRFSIPTTNVPIQTIPIDEQKYQTNPALRDINRTAYGIRVEWDGHAYSVPLEWITQSESTEVPEPTDVGKDLTRFFRYYSLYNINHFLDLLNTAVAGAVNQLVVNDSFPVAQPPFFKFDASTELISLYTPIQWANNFATPPNGSRPKLFFGTELYNNFGDSFQSNLITFAENNPIVAPPDFRNWELIIQNRTANQVELPAPYDTFDMLEIQQEYSSNILFTSFKSILITSNTMPIRSEWISGQSVGGQNKGQTKQISDTSFQILTDFEVQADKLSELRTYIHYIPSAEYRRTTLEGDLDITNLDFSIFYRDNNGVIYPLQIPYGQTATIKILFEER
jgi:hypothetical protein